MTEAEETSSISLHARLEALLFVAGEPVSPSQLAAALETTPAQVEAALADMEKAFVGRGIHIQRHAGKVQFTTAPEAAASVEAFLGLDSTARLSTAAVEALAIIAYKQPVTRPQIDAIRGVNSDGVLRSLLRKGLVEEAGRSEAVGRPILYITTTDFLQHFGLNSLDELPPLEVELPEEPAG